MSKVKIVSLFNLLITKAGLLYFLECLTLFICSVYFLIKKATVANTEL